MLGSGDGLASVADPKDNGTYKEVPSMVYYDSTDCMV